MKFLAKKNHGGFTIIEMLVVLTIIGIIVGLTMVSFGGSQKSARDTQRMSDLKQYQNALEVYANKNGGLFPGRNDAAGIPAQSTLCPYLGLSGCPADPVYTGTDGYRYQSNGSGGTANATKYVLWATLEGQSGYYWVVCSEGKSGATSTGIPPSSGACPL